MGKILAAGMLSVFDPSGRVLTARPDCQPTYGRTFGGGVDALIEALSAVESKKRGVTIAAAVNAPLSRLRMAAVTASFLCAVSTLVLCIIAIASDTAWPLIAVSAISAGATIAIVLFFGVLRWTLNRQALELQTRHRMRAVLREMAEAKVSAMEAGRLLRLSQHNPKLANAILVEIMTEYTDAEHSPDQLPGQIDGGGISVDRLMQTASANHVVVRTLRRLASDVSEARSSDVSEAL